MGGYLAIMSKANLLLLAISYGGQLGSPCAIHPPIHPPPQPAPEYTIITLLSITSICQRREVLSSINVSLEF